MTIRSPALAFALALATILSSAAPTNADDSFRFRGYYITLMRMPTMDLPAWRETIDCLHHDGGNTLLLWMGGAFRSRKFPITWQYNREHKNIQTDFVGELIDYAHGQGVKVLLAFTPFAYDGVNQYPIEHPELKATQRNGSPANLWGMHSWGYNLCPSRPDSQRFMLEYVRELLFDFYPKADGLMIESSDYAICFCANCREKFFEKEFQFVEQISQEVWRTKPGAMILVYPHYFSGRTVPGFNVSAAKQTFDPRWTLFFTPHSAHIDPELLGAAKTSIYWEDTTTLGTPARIRAAAQKARQFHITGFVPSLEAYSFLMEHPEGGELHLVGTRLKPFGFSWLRDGEMPFNELLVRVNRTAYREFSRNPAMTDADFKAVLRAEFFGTSGKAQAADDLLFLQETWFLDRSWWSASPILSPSFLKKRAAQEKWTAQRLAGYRDRLQRVRRIVGSYRDAASAAEREMSRIAQLMTQIWDAAEPGIPGQGPGSDQ